MTIVKELVHHLAQLFDLKFTSIGSLRPPECSQHGKEPSGFRVGRMVSRQRPNEADSLEDTRDKVMSLGPYQSTVQWLSDRLDAAIAEHERSLLTKEDQVVKEYIASTIEFGHRLQKIIPTYIPSSDPEPGSTRILHPDLHECNVLINPHRALNVRRTKTMATSRRGDEEGIHQGQIVTGLLDWEYVSVVPLWQACQLPDMLSRMDRHKPPRPLEADVADDPDMVEYQQQDWNEYEQTLLKKTFLDEMKRVQPRWVKVYEEGAFKRDLVRAVRTVELGLVKEKSKWIECLVKGEIIHQRSEEDWQEYYRSVWD